MKSYSSTLLLFNDYFLSLRPRKPFTYPSDGAWASVPVNIRFSEDSHGISVIFSSPGPPVEVIIESLPLISSGSNVLELLKMEI